MTLDGQYRAVVLASVADALRLLSVVGDEADLRDADQVPDDWSLEPEARAILLAIVRTISPRCYVEIGAHQGRTCRAVAELMADYGHGRAFAIEPNEILASRIESEAKDLQLPIVVIPMDSRSAFELWGREPIDIVLIDGSHTLSDTLFDIAAWSSLLAPNGWILVHDTRTRLLRRFPEDYMSVPEIFDIIDIVGLEKQASHHSWEGLAILRWAAEIKPIVRRRFVKLTRGAGE